MPLVFAQWNAEGLRKQKPELQEFLKREGVDIICIQETHLTDAHRFTIRGYELFRHDKADRHKGGIVTLVRNTISAMEVGRSEGDSEYLAIRVVVQGREITVINYYCLPETCNYTLFHWSTTTYSSPATSMATLQAGDMLISIAEESK